MAAIALATITWFSLPRAPHDVSQSAEPAKPIASIAIPVIAAEVSISAMVAHDLAASAIDAKKNELLIVTAVCRENLEMLSIASRAVGQIQCLANTGDNLHLALAKIFYSP